MQPSCTGISELLARIRRKWTNLVKHSQLVGCKGAHDGMKDPPVMEKDHIVLAPILGVDELSSVDSKCEQRLWARRLTSGAIPGR